MSDTPDLRVLLQRIGTELAAQAQVAEAIGELVPLLPELDEPMQARAQSIDALAQHLDELSRLLDRLAPLAPKDAVMPGVIEAVRLSDLLIRLKGSREATAAESGSVDFF
jgi:hypothetical protein